MKTIRMLIFLTLLIIAFASIAFAGTVTYTQNGYTLNLTDNATNFSATTKQNMVNTFFTVYPKEAARFNPNTAKTVTFIIDPNYTGVAYTGGAQTTYSASYMTSYPQDYDVVTHEVMHIVQAYTGSSMPIWATEGLADYARYKYGVNNAAAGWSLPNYSSTQKYTDSYRVTARFFVWLELKYGSAILDNLNTAGRNNTYTSNFWVSQTGKTVDQLWTDYAANPSLSGPTPTPVPAGKVIPGRIEAESYNAMSGVGVEATSDTGGGQNVGWIETNDWMDYSVNVQSGGSYRIDYRVASPNTTGKVDFRVNGVTLASTMIPNTGGWQAWTTVSATVSLNAGAQTARLFASGGGWNINWFSATATSTTTGVVFYQDANYGGVASQVFVKGTYTLSQLMAKGVSNDWMSSLKVPSGWTVIVYQNDNFGGTTWTFTGDTTWVGSACNDQMSSVKIQ